MRKNAKKWTLQNLQRSPLVLVQGYIIENLRGKSPSLLSIYSDRPYVYMTYIRISPEVDPAKFFAGRERFVLFACIGDVKVIKTADSSLRHILTGCHGFGLMP